MPIHVEEVEFSTSQLTDPRFLLVPVSSPFYLVSLEHVSVKMSVFPLARKLVFNLCLMDRWLQLVSVQVTRPTSTGVSLQ